MKLDSIEDIKKAVPEAFRNFQPSEHTFTDACKCKKPRDCWGQDRWHHVVLTEKHVERLATIEWERRVAAEAMPDSEKHELWLHLKSQYQSYIGVKYAYESCPEATARIARYYDQRRAEREAEHRGHTDLVV